MSNWCLGCHREILDGDYCRSCQMAGNINSLGQPRQLETYDINHENWLSFVNDPRYDELPQPLPEPTLEVVNEEPDDPIPF